MQFIPFAIFVLVGSFSPGPNVVMSIESGRTNGMRASLPFFAGMSTGFGFVMLVAALFNKYLLAVMPVARPFLGAAGAAYMVWLAVKQFLPKRAGEGRKVEAATPFLRGVALQFVNPKVILYGLTVMASFVLPHYDAAGTLALFSASLSLVCFASLSTWGYFGTIFQKHLSAHETLLNVVMAALLLYCAWSVSGLGAYTAP